MIILKIRVFCFYICMTGNKYLKGYRSEKEIIGYNHKKNRCSTYWLGKLQDN